MIKANYEGAILVALKARKKEKRAKLLLTQLGEGVFGIPIGYALKSGIWGELFDKYQYAPIDILINDFMGDLVEGIETNLAKFAPGYQEEEKKQAHVALTRGNFYKNVDETKINMSTLFITSDLPGYWWRARGHQAQFYQDYITNPKKKQDKWRSAFDMKYFGKPSTSVYHVDSYGEKRYYIEASPESKLIPIAMTNSYILWNTERNLYLSGKNGQRPNLKSVFNPNFLPLNYDVESKTWQSNKSENVLHPNLDMFRYRDSRLWLGRNHLLQGQTLVETSETLPFEKNTSGVLLASDNSFTYVDIVVPLDSEQYFIKLTRKLNLQMSTLIKNAYFDLDLVVQDPEEPFIFLHGSADNPNHWTMNWKKFLQTEIIQTRTELDGSIENAWKKLVGIPKFELRTPVENLPRVLGYIGIFIAERQPCLVKKTFNRVFLESNLTIDHHDCVYAILNKQGRPMNNYIIPKVAAKKNNIQLHHVIRLINPNGTSFE